MVKRILFQGDSVTDCGRSRETICNDGLGEGYAMLCASELLYKFPERNYEVFNRGISGNRVVDLFARWKIDALNIAPDVISILIGVNDTWHEFSHNNGVSLEQYETVYRMLIEWTKKALPNVKIMLLEPFTLPGVAVKDTFAADVVKRGLIVEKLAKELKCTFVPLQAKLSLAADLKGDTTYYLKDGVHPTLAGHKLISEIWLEALQKL